MRLEQDITKNKSILVLGGTGAMGSALVNILGNMRLNVVVTSRSPHQHSSPNVHFVQGNAKEDRFLDSLLLKPWDAIVDFMSYTTSEFETKISKFLNSTNQYLFLSSARVYAKSDRAITENTPRLIDVCDDLEYLRTDEYALAKARQEDMIISCKQNNFTIIRPSLTYDNRRLQFAICEKEGWLYRAINGRTVVFPDNIKNVITTMTYGYDVANAISKIIGNENARGEIIQIASPIFLTWNDVFNIYRKVLKTRCNIIPKLYGDVDALEVGKANGKVYQLKYARAINRKFDCSKLNSIIGEFSFASPEIGLSKCLNEFLDHPCFNSLSWREQSYFDKLCNERTKVTEFQSLKDGLYYVLSRYL